MDTCGSCGAERYSLANICDSCTNELQQLREVAKGLPHTRDGKPMYPGMKVRGGWEGEGEVHSISSAHGAMVAQPGGLFYRVGDECSSTPQ